MNIEQTIEQVEKLYQRIAGQIPPAATTPVNPDVNLSLLLDMRMTQLLQMLQDPTVQGRLQPWTPPTSIWEGDDKITVCMEVCGINKSEVDISIRENLLIVSGVRRSIAPAGVAQQPRRLEIPAGSFQRVVVLPPGPCQSRNFFFFAGWSSGNHADEKRTKKFEWQWYRQKE